jgi:integrase
MKRKLPPRVYLNHGAYYYVTLDRKWIRLGKTESEMYSGLAKIKSNISDEGLLRHYLDRYLKEVIPTQAKSSLSSSYSRIKFLRHAFGHMTPESIKPKHIYSYMDARALTSKVSANREKALLSAVFISLIRWGVVEANPCRVVKNFPEKVRDRYVTDAEYKAVFNIASPIMKAAMEIASITGMRRGDILNLKYSDFTEKGIQLTQSKTKKKQVFEWTPDLIEAVEMAKKCKRHADSIVYVIATSRGQQFKSNSFGHNWVNLMDKAVESGIILERFNFHDLRAKAGSDAKGNAQELLGHASASTTRRVYLRKPASVKPVR